MKKLINYILVVLKKCVVSLTGIPSPLICFSSLVPLQFLLVCGVLQLYLGAFYLHIFEYCLGLDIVFVSLIFIHSFNKYLFLRCPMFSRCQGHRVEQKEVPTFGELKY